MSTVTTSTKLAARTPEQARTEFLSLERQLLAHYGVQAQARTLTLRRPATRVRVLVAGDGEPVLFFHGGDGEAVNWAPLMARLQRDVRLVGVNRPGFGLSDPFDYSKVDLRTHAGDVVVSILDELGIERATLLGGSMGGFFALCAAIDHPSRVARLGLMGMAVGLSREASPELRRLCGEPGAPQAFMQQVASLEGQRSQYRHMFGIDPDTVPELYFRTRLAGLLLPGCQDTWALLLTRLADLQGFRPEVYLGDDLHRIRAVTSILWGDHDMAPAALGEKSAAAIREARFVRLPGVGHFPFLEAPDRAADEVRALLGRGASASARPGPGTRGGS